MAGLRRDIIIVFGSTFVSSILAMIAVPILIRTVGADRFSHIALVLVIVNIFGTFDGLRQIVVYDFADNGKHSKLIEGCVLLSLCISTFVVCAGLCIWLVTGGTFFSALEIFFLLFTGFLFYPTSILNGMLAASNFIGYVSLLRALCWIGIYGGFLFLGVQGAAFEWYSGAVFIFYLMLFLCLLFRVLYNGHGKYLIPSSDQLKKIKPKLVDTLLFEFAVLILSNFSRILLSYKQMGASLGVYLAQSEVILKGIIVFRVINSIVLPRLTAARHCKSKDWIERCWYFIFLLGFYAVGFIMAVIEYFHVEIITFIFGSEFANFEYIGGILLLSYPLMFIGYASNSLLASGGVFDISRKVYLKWSMLTLFVGCFLIFKFGLVGAATAYLFGRFCDLYLFVETTKSQSFNFSVKSFYIHFLFVLIMMAAAFFQYPILIVVSIPWAYFAVSYELKRLEIMFSWRG
ncbi:MAG: hypothetical protein JKY55_20300 [Aliivibrio sp.]|uniref:hypothetical protein n=1 Tax=Aliivibrio sp. TaxID=1872443 RepID=UPI001A5CC65F|nr:hypothetical protein [Aliivibrio sp.]